MGIKNFYKFIQKYAPGAIKTTRITDYQNKTIGIDANLMLYKMIYGIRANGYDLKNGDIIITHLHALLLKLIAFKKYKITPVFVFDNLPPDIKYKTLKDRQEVKTKLINKYKDDTSDRGKRIHYYIKSNLTQTEIEECQQLINLFGFLTLEAKEEADAQLAYLYNNKLIDYIVSEDMDILLFGGGKLIKKFSVSKTQKLLEIDLDILLKESKLTITQLRDLGILMGSDYCDNKGISFNKAYKLIQEYDTLLKVPKSMFNYNCKKARKYFKSPPVHKMKDIKNDNKFNLSKLNDFLRKFKFSDNYLDNLSQRIIYGSK